MQLDKIGESLLSGQSSAALEVVLQLPIMTDLKVTTCRDFGRD